MWKSLHQEFHGRRTENKRNAEKKCFMLREICCKHKWLVGKICGPRVKWALSEKLDPGIYCNHLPKEERQFSQNTLSSILLWPYVGIWPRRTIKRIQQKDEHLPEKKQKFPSFFSAKFSAQKYPPPKKLDLSSTKVSTQNFWNNINTAFSNDWKIC